MAYKKQKNVNIDALIAREDFEAADETTNTASKISTLSVNDLKEGSGLFLASVRKPDFIPTREIFAQLLFMEQSSLFAL